VVLTIKFYSTAFLNTTAQTGHLLIGAIAIASSKVGAPKEHNVSK